MTALTRTLVAASAFAALLAVPASAKGVNSAPLQAVVQAAVKGRSVDYNAVEKNRSKLQGYLKEAAAADVSGMSKNAKLAFYVNTYNALVLEAVLTHKRPKSVLDVKGFFDSIKYTVAGEQLTLNELEEKKIRSMGDPRIHFVVNCASVGCPPLAGGLYTEKNMQAALTKATHGYLGRDGEVVIDDKKKTIEVTQLFNWYQKDFGGEKGVREFLAKHFAAEQLADMRAKILDPSYKLTYREYDWRLNAAK